MKIRKTIAAAALLLVAVVPLAACGTTGETATTSATTQVQQAGPGGQSGPGGVDVSSVSSVEDLNALVQSAYGEAGLGLHRGHEPVQDVLDEVLSISHDELHVRMDSGQNLAAIATDLGIDPQTLVDAMVESWSPAIDDLVSAGTITQAQGEQYRAALTEAFTFKVNWDGQEATPTFTGA
ncbi:hypothetical protein SAMN04488564_111117 [Lentzea waywayandensis]|uniref:SurA N-terminal domain-containing protein n=1 Tax=Lentzea waywayandensis TaxID=84724 RepID=A0A1I6FCE6_9PSEU|nr:hypothetical protein [Lentzea waywayandensis]SFR27578.1 hypothetical protein SAMN04488564_111117 [Lentzea waywayandensis]